MSPGPRDYSRAVRAALATLSRGNCYFPGCERSIIVFVNEEPYFDAHIAHIYDAHPGNRYNPDMTVDQRRSFSNFILLCKPHHDLVDRTHPEQYGPNTLLAWKAEREGERGDILQRESSLDETVLEDALLQMSISISVGNGSVYIGGTGGSAPGAGGGGGGVLGSGIGGPGGPGGTAIDPEVQIVLDGQAGEAPGAGGGGGGVILPEQLGPGLVPAGRGFSEGLDGRDGQGSSFGEGDKVLISAPGGVGGLAGTGRRSSPQDLAVSSLMLMNYAEVRDGLVFISAGGWENLSLLNVPSTFQLPVTILFEAGNEVVGEYSIFIEVLDPSGVERGRISFPLTVVESGRVVRIPRCDNIPIEVKEFGVWRIIVRSDADQMATLDFVIKRIGES